MGLEKTKKVLFVFTDGQKELVINLFALQILCPVRLLILYAGRQLHKLRYSGIPFTRTTKLEKSTN